MAATCCQRGQEKLCLDGQVKGAGLAKTLTRWSRAGLGWPLSLPPRRSFGSAVGCTPAGAERWGHTPWQPLMRDGLLCSQRPARRGGQAGQPTDGTGRTLGGAGRDLLRGFLWSEPTCSSWVTEGRVPRTAFSWALTINTDGDSTTSLGKPVPLFDHAHGKEAKVRLQPR